ncbi:STAS domain-containing protein [Streptomyces sp. HC44]|uniref:Anti-sigma factor antagonist n=1 Tax=Streptomyces scabichelini TaxID=2711217 RepID=A0A6G4VF74_9ACTN|nr:STAS domain-containing protein [Streptomyces scabichelini]NGO12621.1 STAS domain-containing protein [Streptomyces scabichelini]
MVEHPNYGLRERTLSGSTVIELSGELDLLATTELMTSLDAVCNTQPRHLVLDMRQVTFLDCSGLSLLCRVRNRLRGERSRLLLVLDDARHKRLLRLTRLSDSFDIVADLASALAGPSPHGPAGARKDDIA